MTSYSCVSNGGLPLTISICTKVATAIKIRWCLFLSFRVKLHFGLHWNYVHPISIPLSIQNIINQVFLEWGFMVLFKNGSQNVHAWVWVQIIWNGYGTMINVRHTLKSHINGHTLSVWRGLMGISIDCDKSTLGGSTGTFAYA